MRRRNSVVCPTKVLLGEKLIQKLQIVFQAVTKVSKGENCKLPVYNLVKILSFTGILWLFCSQFSKISKKTFSKNSFESPC